MDYRIRCFNRRTTQAKVSLDNVKLRRLVRFFFDKILERKYFLFNFFFRYLDCGYDAWLYTGSGPENNWCSPYKGRILKLYFFMYLVYDRDFTSWSQELLFLSFHLLFPISIWTFISLFSLDFYCPFFFGLLFSLFSLDFYFPFLFGLLFPFFLWTFIFPFLFGLLFPFPLWTFISLFSLGLLFNRGHILDFFQILKCDKRF